ncbi:hypothetical protein [Cellulomonas sp. S1-8]|uniref:hypothetical protein n=1 Tax=Cellulomonas sp. S1-8 TaxID=2904790 RepID=UPI002244AB09|nr:hypothetical protein [Cellulomonas sp. S1-8]UZN03077.1 hypothetical protein OKX07_18810 [Cellulomonas sp. S1-8]
MDLGVLERLPEAGDVGAVDGLVAGYVARAERFTSRAVSVRAAGDALVGASVGSWASALGERSVRVASGMDDAAGGCRQVAQVLAGYAAALRALERRVMVARHEVATARIRAVAARERYAAAALAGGVAVVPWSWMDAPTHAAVPEAAAELRVWRDAVGQATSGLRAFTVCCDEREDLDRDTATRLVGVDVMAAYAPGTGVDAVVDVPLVQALAAAGAGTVTAEQRRVLAGWFVDAVETVADDPHDAAAAALLTGFLEAWNDDAEAMSTVFAAVGGAGVARLLVALGHARLVGAGQRNFAVVDSAAAVRSGLATASKAWTTAAAQAFAVEMVSVAKSTRGALSVIGYLFADPSGARMGESFTVAMADQLDAVERELGGAWREGPGSLGDGLASHGNITTGVPVHDPAVHVLATLGTYPQAARDWLTGGDQQRSTLGVMFGTTRVGHWFGERDWSVSASDGFSALGALWVDVQSPCADVSAEAKQVAAINTLVFQALSQNPTLGPGHVSPAGAENLARAISAQFPGIVEVGIASSVPSGVVAKTLWEEVDVPYLDGDVATAVLQHDWVGPVLRSAVSESAGREIISDSVLSFQEQALEAAHAGRASPGTVLDRLATVWGAVDGATVSAAEVQRFERDAETRARLDAARNAIDAGVALSPVRPMASIGVDQALNQLHQLTEAALTNQPLPESATRSNIPAGVESLDDFFEQSIHDFRQAGSWDKEGVHAGDTSSTDAHRIAREYVHRYNLTVDAMRANAMDHVREQG